MGCITRLQVGGGHGEGAQELGAVCIQERREPGKQAAGLRSGKSDKGAGAIEQELVVPLLTGAIELHGGAGHLAGTLQQIITARMCKPGGGKGAIQPGAS